MKSLLLPLVWVMLLPTLLRSQEPVGRPALFIEASFKTGPVLDIYPNLPELGLAWSGEVNIGWQTAGNRYWNQPMRFPKTGMLVSVTELGNPDVLGREFSLVPNLSYRFASFGSFRLHGFIGLGFAWFNKPYDRLTNPDNKLIGSRVTNKTMLGLDLEYFFHDLFSARAGISYLHYSNGHTQLPNIGINIPSVGAGFIYYPRGRPHTFHYSDSIPAVDRRWMVNLRFGIGMHEFGDPVKPAGGSKYPVYNGSLYLSKRVGVIINLHAGLHLNYYTSFYDYLAFHDLREGDRRWRSMSVIGFGGAEFLMGHFGFTTQMGLYLYNPTYSEIHDLYNSSKKFKEIMKHWLTYKFGASYYIYSTRNSTRVNPWVGLFLKSNAGQADFAEISIGIAF